MDDAKNMVDSFIKKSSNQILFLKEKLNTWNYNTKLLFLDILLERSKEIDNEIYISLRDLLKLYENQNTQVLHSWFLLALKLNKSDVIPFLDEFLFENGAFDYLVDLYKEYFIMDKISALKSFDSNR